MHLAAIAIERKGEHYSDTNTGATDLLIEAARFEKVDRLILCRRTALRAAHPTLPAQQGPAQEAVMKQRNEMDGAAAVRDLRG